MSKLKLKIKSNLKNDIEKEKKGGKDTRLLNYFDMKENEKMTILFVPDASGENLWSKFSVHGPNLKVPGLDKVACAKKSSGEHCPACQKAFDLLEEGKKPGNDYDVYKEEAKRWFPKDSTVAQCLVLESPMDVNESPDGNQVKIMYLPYAIENIIKEAVVEGIVDEEDICLTPFVIKKTKNQGGHASYANSYFARKTISEDELAVFEDFTVEQYAYDTLDLIPKPSSTDEVREWLEMAVDKVASSDDTKSDEDKESGNKKLASVTDRLGGKAKQHEDDGDSDKDDSDSNDEDTTSHQQEDTSDSQEQESKPSGASALRDRLNSLKR